ncbi:MULTISPECIES: DUF1284 domain-containing protein [Cohnella]|uniref:DUF1284 domain-containing protein n=1 Tax=Cohnella TaxID=329857 RepID=UPI0009BBF591|nr:MULTISPECIES: DUF1284 domain-containing protein [Cohnella]MBN2980878.1 DUF1284 domain-containing protein [Cohnella algarum]
MTIRLRGHHLLCLLGFRGKGYSEEFCVNMTSVYETLRADPDTPIAIIEGPDDICRAFPADQPNHCHNESVYRKDRDILLKLGLRPGLNASWTEIVGRVTEHVRPRDIDRFCHDCPWQPLGLCQEGVAHIRSGRPLRPLPGKTTG